MTIQASRFFAGFAKLMFTMRGRLARRNFLGLGVVLWSLFVILFVFLETTLGHQSTLLLYPAFFWSATALMARRLHDRDKSALWILLVAIPVLGPLWLLIDLALRAGTKGENRFGEDPRQSGTDYLKLT